MNNRSHVAGGTIAVVAALAFAMTGAEAAPSLPQPEKSLLGIHLMSGFADVLKKFGQPNDIQVGSPIAPASSGAQAPGMGGIGGGGMMGGMPGMGGMMRGRMGGAPMGGMPGGIPGAPMGGGLPGFAGGGSSAGAGRQFMMQGRGGMPGMPGAPMGMMGGGKGEGMGGAPVGGLPGMGASIPGFSAGNTSGLPGSIGSGAVPQAEDNPSEDTTWWYKYPKTGLYYAFLFNREGRVIQIQEFGWAGAKGTATRQGIALGASLGQLVHKYGWSEDGDRVGTELTLRYGGKERLAFQLIKNKVAGITLAEVH